MSYLFGPAGWSYPDWKGPVYPSPLPKNFDHLGFLSQSFDFVEVNTSFYQIPSVALTSGWVRKTAAKPDFTFWVKLHQDFTHGQILAEIAVRTFLESLQPLLQAGKLSGLLAQFPYSFKYSSANLAHIIRIAETFRPHPLAIEIRHKSWDQEKVCEIFRCENLVWTNIDQPVISQSLPLTAHVTHSYMSYVRLHGRNYQNWFANTGRDARYDYEYSMTELTDMARLIRRLRHEAQKIFISGNNHYKGSAVRNLLILKKILKEMEQPEA
jgi:uncharacterized protein YecE (DUF72 family)